MITGHELIRGYGKLCNVTMTISCLSYYYAALINCCLYALHVCARAQVVRRVHTRNNGLNMRT